MQPISAVIVCYTPDEFIETVHFVRKNLNPKFYNYSDEKLAEQWNDSIGFAFHPAIRIEPERTRNSAGVGDSEYYTESRSDLPQMTLSEYYELIEKIAPISVDVSEYL